MIAIQATLGGVVAFAVFWVLDRLRPGGFGWGDGKYVPILGAATGAVSLTVAWWGFLIACVAAILASHYRPEFIGNVKETGKILMVDYSFLKDPETTEIEAERFLHDGGLDSTHRYFMVAANARDRKSVV